MIRWENTIAPWYESEGFERGENEPCAYLYETKNLLSLLYVDDAILDGDNDDIDWMSSRMDARFLCKDIEHLTNTTPLDCLGMEILCDADHMYLCMGNYIRSCLKILGLEDAAVADTPISESIDKDSDPLDVA